MFPYLGESNHSFQLHQWPLAAFVFTLPVSVELLISVAAFVFFFFFFFDLLKQVGLHRSTSSPVELGKRIL